MKDAYPNEMVPMQLHTFSCPYKACKI